MAKKKPITPRQAAARRENGRKGRGPKTEEGKARSRRNALKAGVYAVLGDRIETGPLAEDGEEYKKYRDALLNELYTQEVEKLGLDESPMLLEVVEELINKLRNKKRWRAWSALTFEDTAPSSPLPPASAYTEMVMDMDLTAASTLRDVSNASATDLDKALTAIGTHPIMRGDRSWERLRYPAHRDKVLATLLLILENHGVGLEIAADVLEARAEEQAPRLKEQRRDDAILGVKELLGGDSLRRLIAAESHTSRELDRAYKQYLMILNDLKEFADSENEPTDL